METPVVLIIFSRTGTLRRVLETLRQARPRQLYVVADGPRAGVPHEAEKCEAARAVIDAVDWDCEVYRDYSDHNLGCTVRIYSGITAALEKFGRAVILEDDCLPHPSFFEYCDTLLERYRDDTRIANLSGNNFLDVTERKQRGYYFSKYFQCWGWATWKRAWDHYDLSMSDWPAWRDSGGLAGVISNPAEQQFWTRIFDYCYRGDIDAWCYPWMYHCLKHRALTVAPNTNLVQNIGFSPNATHTTEQPVYDLSLQALTDLSPPPVVGIDERADEITFRVRFQFEDREQGTGQGRQPDAGSSQAGDRTDSRPLRGKLAESLKSQLLPSSLRRRLELRRLRKLPRGQVAQTTLPGIPMTIADTESFLVDYETVYRKRRYAFHPRWHSPLIIDGCAADGLLVLYFKQHLPNSRIIACDDDPLRFSILSENVRAWDFQDVELCHSPQRSAAARTGFERLFEYQRGAIDFLRLRLTDGDVGRFADCEPHLHNVRKLCLLYHSVPNERVALTRLLEILERCRFQVSIDSGSIELDHPFYAAPQSSGAEFSLQIFAWRRLHCENTCPPPVRKKRAA